MKRLKSLRIDELSVVDRPASPGALQLFWKRDGMSVGEKFASLIRRITKGGPTADEAATELAVLVDKDDDGGTTEQIVSTMEKMGQQVETLTHLVKVDEDEKMILSTMSDDERLAYAKMSDEDKLKKRAELAEAAAKKPPAAGDKPPGEEPGEEGGEDEPDDENAEAEDGKTPPAGKDKMPPGKDKMPPGKDKPKDEGKTPPADDEEKRKVTKSAEETAQAETVNKAVDSATAPLLERIAKMEGERLHEALLKEWTPLAKAASLPPDDLVGLVKAMTPEARETFKKGLTATNALLDKSMLFQEIGKSHRGPVGGAEEQLETLAKRHATDNNVAFTAAYDAVLKTAEGKRLYAESRSAKH